MRNKATEIVPLDLSGPKEETLFWDVYLDPEIITSGYEKIKTQYAALQKHLGELTDERSLSLVGAMIIESYLDGLLESYIPNYKSLGKVRDFTFSFKIEMALALKLIPSKILNAITPIRKIRNNFAHQLDVKNYKDYIDKLGKRDFESLLNKMKTFGDFPKSNPRNMFETLVTSISYGLLFYTEMVDSFSKKTRNRDFVDKLFNNSRTLSDNFPDQESKKRFPVAKLNQTKEAK